MTWAKFGVLIVLMIACWLGQHVEGFSSSPSSRRIHLGKDFRCRRQSKPNPIIRNTSSESLQSVVCLSAKKKKAADDADKSGSTSTSPATIWKTIQEKPGGLILLPFVVIFGLDLLLNIIFLTKRSFEFFVLGQAPSQKTWF
jgi:hypothetical protein